MSYELFVLFRTKFYPSLSLVLLYLVTNDCVLISLLQRQNVGLLAAALDVLSSFYLCLEKQVKKMICKQKHHHEFVEIDVSDLSVGCVSYSQVTMLLTQCSKLNFCVPTTWSHC